MSNFVRRIVSGNKARFKDANLNMELDLVYVTDHVIIMGFPATGVEGMYRNHREDAKKFLDHRHGKNYWVFNFCPLRENSYPASFFEGRVSRYPFPDHHAPPLVILSLFVREMHEWLGGSKDRVAVLHCKAGKGRSGTLACAYLLASDEAPIPPKFQRSPSKKEWAERRADQVMDRVETVDMESDAAVNEEEARGFQGGEAAVNGLSNGSSSKQILDGASLVMTPPSETADGISAARAPIVSRRNTLDEVLALHTAQRMKAPSDPSKKLKQGVSIPSQRRFLHYWSLLLAGAGPSGFWSSAPSPPPTLPRVRLLEIRVRLRELHGVKKGLVRIANELLERKASGKRKDRGDRGTGGVGPVWVSLARYDDALVDVLESWERHTRSEDGHFGRRRQGSEEMNGDAIQDIFKSGEWDKVKMIKSFARLGTTKGATPEKQQSEAGNVLSYTLRPLSNRNLEDLNEKIKDSPNGDAQAPGSSKKSTSNAPVASAKSSITDLTGLGENTNLNPHDTSTPNVFLDAGREVRAKIFLGRVFVGWFWFVPIFHMPTPPSSTRQETAHITLSRKEVDFPVGAGAALVDIDVSLEWAIPPPSGPESVSAASIIGANPGTAAGNVVVPEPPRLQNSGDSLDEPSTDSALAAAAQVVASGGATSTGEAVEAVEAAKES